MAENFQKPQQKIEPIEEIAPRHPVDQVQDADTLNAPEKVKFDQALERVDKAKADLELSKVQAQEAAKAPQKPSILDIAREAKAVPVVPPTTETVVSDAAKLKNSFKAPQAYLMSYQSKNIEIPQEFVKQMDARIEHMDNAMIDAKMITSGAPVASAAGAPSGSPTVRFLRYLTDADGRLDTIIADINSSTAKGNRLSPEKLLAIQIKLNYVNQELEFFTNILNRSIESIKTLMNVQI